MGSRSDKQRLWKIAPSLIEARRAKMQVGDITVIQRITETIAETKHTETPRHALRQSLWESQTTDVKTKVLTDKDCF